jgi:phosphate-selective porin OprO/OprP
VAKLLTSDSNSNYIHFPPKKESHTTEPINDKSLSLLILLLIWLFTFVEITEAKEKNEDSKILSAQSLKLSGYTQVSYSLRDQSKKGFRIRQARLRLKGDILKNINYKLQIDAVLTPILLDVQIDFNLAPHIKLTFGQFKVPFSIENLISGSDLDTINRSHTVEKLCPGRDIGAKGRDIGVAINGEFSRIKYILGVFNGSGINKADYNNQKDIAGRVVFYPDSFLVFGLSHYNGRYSPYPKAPFVKRNRTGIDVFFVNGRLSLKGEYILAREDNTDRHGWYIQGDYYFGKRKIQTVIKYDSLDTKGIRGDKIDIVTFGLNLFFTDKTKFQINYEYRIGELGKISNHVILAQLQAGF